MFTNSALMKHTDKLSRFAWKLTKNRADAEDLLQSTILRALEKRHLYKEDTNLLGWASRLMFNLFASNYRKSSRMVTFHDPESLSKENTTEAGQDTSFRCKEVYHAIQKLSSEHKRVLELVCFEGMTYEEVSVQEDINIGTVRSRLSRARTHLHELVNTSSMENTAQMAA